MTTSNLSVVVSGNHDLVVVIFREHVGWLPELVEVVEVLGAVGDEMLFVAEPVPVSIVEIGLGPWEPAVSVSPAVSSYITLPTS